MPDTTTGRAFLARLARFGVVLGMILLALIASLIVLQVAARNFFDAGLPWADELARFSGIGLVFFVVPCLAGRQVLVTVSLVPDLLGAAARRWLVLVADMATLAFAGLMIWSFAEFLPRAGKFLTPAMRLPNWVYYSLALAGCLVLALIAILRVVDALRGHDPTEPYRDARDADGLPL
ncbi:MULTISPECIES: TRAP transporter small permease [Roseobacteraceae]|uniref:TRAP transporter small permease protein n=1 Tax=Pseudosulfitobacter pseudonitzschiae TaxID=1402135 RepID=A0A221K7D5_9RHOB|nr:MULTISPECIES: TRAP transporter small permease subunit [Roseobacteraceae]ASM74911.1 tripartite ATP-independent periplasmic transporter, DctQ component [Pseudosulfitobacter pseudonitzschiae]